MTLATSLTEVTDALFDKFVSNQVALGIQGVFYGDQNKLPVTPMLCVEPDKKTNGLKSAFRVIEIRFVVYILLYHSLVASPEANRKAADQMAETIETLVHADRTLKRLDGSDRVIHCMIEEVASGYVTKAGSLVRASRLTFSATSQNQLPS